MTVNKLGGGVKGILGTIKDNVNATSKEIDISLIVPNPFQVRVNFNEDELQELANSIRKIGIIQPIIVRIKGDGYEIAAGERRFRASKIVGLSKIPVCVKNLTDEDMQTIAIIENIQRSNLNVIEEAEGFNKLINNFNYKQEEVGDIVGKSRAHITNILRLLTLPDEIKEMLSNKELTMAHARALVNHPKAVELAKKIISEGLTVRATEMLIHKKNDKISQLKPGQKKVYLQDMQEKLDKKIGLKSKIEFNKIKNSGKIIIKYSGLDELERFINKF
ncbi:MAG: ParB/RepB/Spo0J family partition protein [Rickettsiales bacterium]|jgi:ParB family chromosome partitioning protein|nr:ParB/RepB/Spo0J family partition protein [Rickettsiales bacterium]